MRSDALQIVQFSNEDEVLTLRPFLRERALSTLFWLLLCATPSAASNSTSSNRSHHAVVAYIAFGKAGSSTMRAILKDRERHHGWTFPPWDSDLKREHAENELCHARTLRDSHGRVFCSTVQNGAVVQTNLGYCELVYPRACRYMTLLREPVSRIVSAYNYFCLHCSEGGRFCHRSLPNIEKQCPSMSIVEYARSLQNVYTRKLGLGSIIDGEIVGEDAYKKARAFVRDESNLVLLLNEFESNSSKGLDGMKQLRLFLGETAGVMSSSPPARFNKNYGKKYAPTKKEVSKIRSILSWDISLFAEATKVMVRKARVQGG